MEHRGYIGKAEFDEEAEVFCGTVINSAAIIHFRGKSVEEMTISFKEGVNEYLATCKEENIKPEKTFSGEFRLRLGSDLHKQIYLQAKRNSESLNSFVTHAVEEALSPYTAKRP